MKLPFTIGSRPIQGNFDALLSALVGARKRGTVNVSVTAATFGSATVTHGLGKTPSVVIATANNDASVTNVGVASIGPTTFAVGVRFLDGVARTTTIVVGWEAIE